MNIRAMKAIAARDLKIVTRSKGVTIPMIILPLILMVVLPGLIGGIVPLLEDMDESPTEDLDMFLSQMPPNILEELTGYNETQTMVAVLLTYFFAPLFLILPMMVASTIAANSFAGEKERKTLEALIYTPTTDTELFIGKTLAAWIPAVLIALVGFVLYSIVVNVASWPTMGKVFFPNAMWLMLIVWVAPAAAGLGLGSMILVSSKANSFQEAYQIGSAVVLPVVMLLFGQVSGVLYFTVGVVFLVGCVLWLIDAAILWFAVKTFQRREIIARL